VSLTTELIPAHSVASRRLMVVLHGLGDSLEGYRFLPAVIGLPWLNYLLVNAPDPYYGGYSWFDIYGEPEPGIRRSRDALMALLDTQRAAGFPSDQTVVFGFSQGCLLSLELGARYPHLLAGIIGISGFVHDPDGLVAAFSPVAREQRFLVTHGAMDPLIPIETMRPQVARLQAAGLRIQWQEFAKAHTLAGEAEFALIRQFIQARF
jgi:phospholipase/carboxylesterase